VTGDRVPRHFAATPDGTGLRIGVALARFNQAVTEQLLAGALRALREHGVADDAIDVATVPGAFELPLCAQRLAVTGRYDAIVCLGAVVRGETPHFDFVAGEAARGIGEVARKHDLPIAFGVLTTDTIEQALARAGGERGNKGFEAAVTALEMAGLLRAVHRF
jgi:6,7-dimethyl-8-ribityllumazine synthase